jgi:hypothetical protein
MVFKVQEDLIIQLFNLWVSRNYPPDILSVEWPNDKQVIRFAWQSGKMREFGYTQARYDVIWQVFNDYWNDHNPVIKATGQHPAKR